MTISTPKCHGQNIAYCYLTHKVFALTQSKYHLFEVFFRHGNAEGSFVRILSKQTKSVT